jgi:hypothetical protein
VDAVPAAGATIQTRILAHHYFPLQFHPSSWSLVVTLAAVDRIASVFAAAVAKPLIDFQLKCGHEK